MTMATTLNLLANLVNICNIIKGHRVIEDIIIGSNSTEDNRFLVSMISTSNMLSQGKCKDQLINMQLMDVMVLSISNSNIK